MAWFPVKVNTAASKLFRLVNVGLQGCVGCLNSIPSGLSEPWNWMLVPQQAECCSMPAKQLTPCKGSEYEGCNPVSSET